MSENKQIPELDAAGLRRFGLTTGIVIGVLFGVVLPWVLDFAWPVWPWVILTVLCVWGIVSPVTLRPVYKGWMRFGLIMSTVTTPLIMGAVFYFVFTPVAFALRVARKDPMSRSLDEGVDTYRKKSIPPDNERLDKPY